MPTGSCLCGSIRYSYEGDPVFTAVCYCDDCRKMPSIAVFQIPRETFAITSGKPKVWTKLSDKNREISNHFCDICGTVLFRTGGAPEVAHCVGIRAGTLDDQTLVEKLVPKIEVFTERRPTWMKAINGAMQLVSQQGVVDDDGTVTSVQQ